MTTTPHTFRWFKASALGIALCCALALAGCGSSTTSATHGDKNAKLDIAAAKAAVAKASKPPTTIGVTQPLKHKPPTGKTYVFLGIPNGAVAAEISGLKAAAASVGWKVKVIPYDQTDPSTLINAFKEALQYHPVAVTLTGIDEKVWKSILPIYRKAGVPIITGCDPTPIDDVVIANVCGADDFKAMGKLMAQWFIADSNGKGDALVDSTPDFPILEALSDSFTQTVKTSCPDCTVKAVTSSVAQATSGAVTQQMVSAVQRDPSVNYLILPFAQFAPGTPAALAAAGVQNQVKIGLQGPTKQDLVDLKAGKVSAIIPLASSYQGWLEVDVAARHLQGLKFSINDGGLPFQLLTKNSDFNVNDDDYKQPSDFPEQFKKLWQVG